MRSAALRTGLVCSAFCAFACGCRSPGEGRDSRIQGDLTAEATVALARRLLSWVPPQSDVWELSPVSLATVAELVGDVEARAYAERAVSHLASPERGALVLLQMARAAQRAGRVRDARRYHRRIAGDYKDTGTAQVAKQESPDRAIQEGAPVPPFDMSSIDAPERRLSNKTLRGKVVLFEFWASWCPSCMDDIASLHALHTRYAGRGLVIVGINASESADKVRSFRRSSWPMPWHNVVLEEESRAEEIVRAFEVTIVPTSILVDREGVIIAAGAGARGDKLEASLARVFDRTAAASTGGAP